jgi:hypothetical protein
MRDGAEATRFDGFTVFPRKTMEEEVQESMRDASEKRESGDGFMA